MSVISPQDAAHVLHFFRSDEGHSGGNFIDSLIAVVAAGDISQQMKLSLAYPGLVGAYFVVMESNSGLDTLRAIHAEQIPA